MLRGGQTGSHSERADEPVLKPRFVPMRMDSDLANGMQDGFVIAWSAGNSLRVPDRFNPQQLRLLLDALGWQP